MSGEAKGRPVILSVFVNGIGFGFTVLEGETLIDWGAKDLRRAKHMQSMTAFSALLEWYKPAIVVMRDDRQDRTHRGKRVQLLLRRMSGAVRRKGIPMCRVSREAIRERFAELGAKNKYEVALEIARRFPELEDRLPRARRLWEPEEYRMGIFDAAALALTCVGRHEGHLHTSSVAHRH